jgi:YD repeat-containing protein
VQGTLLKEKDANGQTTRATYDAFGRMVTIIRPGDTQAAGQVTYHDISQSAITLPLMVESSQLLSGSVTTSVRKYYDGLGRVIQQQTTNVEVNGGAALKDVAVDYVYDGYGRVVKQSLPYAITHNTGYFTHSTTGYYYTKTTYDALGRTLSVKAPNNTKADDDTADTNKTTYLYGLVSNTTSTTVTDPKGN